MRSLSGTLESAQQATSIDALVKIQLTHGEDSYTYDRDRILDINHVEEPNTQTAEVVLNNSDGVLTSLDLQGFQGVISYGAVASGDEYSDCAPLWVLSQRFDSAQGRLTCTLSLVGITNLLADDRASESYTPASDDTKTVKTIIGQILGATLDCYDHCTAYDVVWDSEDSLIDSYKPKDTFRIYTGGTRLAAVRRLLDYTKCVMRAEDDGKIHIFQPTVSGVVYDYEYSLASGHTFFAKAHRKRLVIPNYIVVKSQPDDDPSYSGSAQDTESYNLLPKREYKLMRLESNSQADDIAEAILSKYQLWAELGAADVPVNVAAEVFDYVKVTDSRESDYRVGTIGHLARHYNAGKSEWRMTFSFGSWMNFKSKLANMGLSSADEIEEYFTRLGVKDLYVENIYADNCDFVWLDPDNTIDLSQIGDNLDNLPDGETYARVKSLHLDAGQIKLDENILYANNYDPSSKEHQIKKQQTAPSDPEPDDLWLDTSVSPAVLMIYDAYQLEWVKADPQDLDDLPDGTLYQRTKSSSLTAEGLVILDEVYVDAGGTYGLLKQTDISAGHIKLTSASVIDGEWYNESGVIIDADVGITIIAEDLIFTSGGDSHYIYPASSQLVYLADSKHHFLTASVGEIECSCDVDPGSADNYDLGSSSKYWQDIYTEDIYRQYEKSFDLYDDVELIKQMREDRDRPGFIDQTTIPPVLLETKEHYLSKLQRRYDIQEQEARELLQLAIAKEKRPKKRAKLQYDLAKVGKNKQAKLHQAEQEFTPMISMGTEVSLLMGAIRQISNRIDRMEERLNAIVS